MNWFLCHFWPSLTFSSESVGKKKLHQVTDKQTKTQTLTKTLSPWRKYKTRNSKKKRRKSGKELRMNGRNQWAIRRKWSEFVYVCPIRAVGLANEKFFSIFFFFRCFAKECFVVYSKLFVWLGFWSFWMSNCLGCRALKVCSEGGKDCDCL